MTKALAIQLIHHYRDEYLKMYTTRTCPPLIFEERSYKRSEAVELARYIQNSDEDPYVAVSIFKQDRHLRVRRAKSKHKPEHLIHAYQCGKELSGDILEIMEAMEDDPYILDPMV